MIPIKLELLNFLPYKGLTALDFSGIHVACLTGENGAGKSALLDAMTWALWGKARDGKRSDDELIHYGEAETRVAFTFEVAGGQHQVIRQRKAGRRGQTILELQVFDQASRRWRSLSGMGVRATQAQINDLLRIDYDTFVNSAFIVQGRADAFTVKTPAERKTVLANILGLDQWTVYEARAKERTAALREQILVLDHEIQSIDSELDRREEYVQELAAAERQLNQVLEQLRAAERDMADVAQARQALAATRRQIDDLTRRLSLDEAELREVEADLAAARMKGDPAALAAELAAVQSRVDLLEALEAEHQQLAAERSSIAETNARLQGENSTLIAEADPLKNRITTLENASEPLCPTCGQPLDEAAREQLVRDLQVDLEERRARYADNAARCKQLEQQCQSLDSRLAEFAAQLAERAGLQRRAAELQTAVDGANQAQAAIVTLEARCERWTKSLAADREKLERLQADARNYEIQATEADVRQQEVDRLRFEYRVATEQVGSARQKLSALDGLVQHRENKIAERQKRATAQGIYEELRIAFGKQGVPAMIIEAAVPEIEETANVLLAKMSNGRMNVRFDTQRETKAGEVRETLDIRIADELGTRNYELYSGGEAFRVNFAVRIALSKLLARRAGAQLQTIVIDEGFGTQDAQGRERLIEAINAIQDDFERVLIITHIDELKDAFPTRIHVVKTPEGSQLSIE